MQIPYIQSETRAGEPVQVGGARIIPFARSLRLQIPGRTAGLVWNRPVSVLVQYADGSEKILPIYDLTRLAQLGLLTAGLLAPLLIWRARRSRRVRSS